MTDQLIADLDFALNREVRVHVAHRVVDRPGHHAAPPVVHGQDGDIARHGRQRVGPCLGKAQRQDRGPVHVGAQHRRGDKPRQPCGVARLDGEGGAAQVLARVDRGGEVGGHGQNQPGPAGHGAAHGLGIRGRGGHRVGDVGRMQPLGPAVVDRLKPDGLGLVPVVRGEGQRRHAPCRAVQHRLRVVVDADRRPVAGRVLGRALIGRDRHRHVARRTPRQHDGIALEPRDHAGQCLVHAGGAAALRDADRRLVVVGHVGRDADRTGRAAVGGVERLDPVRYQSGMAQQVVRRHGRRVARDEDGIRAQSAQDPCRQIGVRRLDKEAVVALAAVDLQRLDPHERHVQAAAEDAVLGDDKVVAELGAEDDHGIQAVAAVDRHGRVDRVLHEVRAAVARDVGARALVVLRSLECKGAHGERIVTVAAVQRQHGKVAEHGKGVLARAAVGGQRLADAVGQVAARGERGLEPVPGAEPRETVADDALAVVHLAELERVVAHARRKRRARRVVVDGEMVVSPARGHRQAAGDRRVIVHAFEIVAVPAQQGDHAPSVLAGLLAQQEGVVLGRAVDRQGVQAVMAVLHVDQGRPLPGEVDGIGVAPGPAHQCQVGTDVVRCVRRRQARVHRDRVRPGAAAHLGPARDHLDLGRVRAAAQVEDGDGGVRAVDHHGVVALPHEDGQTVDPVVGDPRAGQAHALDQGGCQAGVAVRGFRRIVHGQPIRDRRRRPHAQHGHGTRAQPVEEAHVIGIALTFAMRRKNIRAADRQITGGDPATADDLVHQRRLERGQNLGGGRAVADHVRRAALEFQNEAGALGQRVVLKLADHGDPLDRVRRVHRLHHLARGQVVEREAVRTRLHHLGAQAQIGARDHQRPADPLQQAGRGARSGRTHGRLVGAMAQHRLQRAGGSGHAQRVVAAQHRDGGEILVGSRHGQMVGALRRDEVQRGQVGIGHVALRDRRGERVPAQGQSAAGRAGSVGQRQDVDRLEPGGVEGQLVHVHAIPFAVEDDGKGPGRGFDGRKSVRIGLEARYDGDPRLVERREACLGKLAQLGLNGRGDRRVVGLRTDRNVDLGPDGDAVLRQTDAEAAQRPVDREKLHLARGHQVIAFADLGRGQRHRVDARDFDLHLRQVDATIDGAVRGLDRVERHLVERRIALHAGHADLGHDDVDRHGVDGDLGRPADQGRPDGGAGRLRVQQARFGRRRILVSTQREEEIALAVRVQRKVGQREALDFGHGGRVAAFAERPLHDGARPAVHGDASRQMAKLRDLADQHIACAVGGFRL